MCFGYRKCAQNFMCPNSDNVPEILSHTAPGKVKEMSKFPGVGNVHAMNKKCELSCTFHEISLPRKLRISSSEGFGCYSYKMFSTEWPGTQVDASNDKMPPPCILLVIKRTAD